MPSEISAKVDLSIIRYAQCWEDADILLAALDPKPEHVCLSVASAGDNTLALLSRGPARVVAVDLSPAQLACLELRVAAYRTLEHAELLELLGARPSTRRRSLYARCSIYLSPSTRAFWDGRGHEVAQGVANIGKFERYLQLFGTRILPLLQTKSARQAILQPRLYDARVRFFDNVWDNLRWRAAFRVFFSRWVIGRLGRDPDFFAYVEEDVPERLLARTRYAFTELDPATNPYLQWILLGQFGDALPYALRPENFDAIRNNLDRLEWHCQPVEDLLAARGPGYFDRYNLSDIFEYMSFANYTTLLQQIITASKPGARLAYWNMMAPRRRPEVLADRLRPLRQLAESLYRQDKAFFYSDFVVEEVI